MADSKRTQRLGFDAILSKLKHNPMTARYTELIKPDWMYVPKELGAKGPGERGLLGISYDRVLDEIVDVYEGVTGTWNAKRTYRSSIAIPGWVALTWVYDHLLVRDERAA